MGGFRLDWGRHFGACVGVLSVGVAKYPDALLRPKKWTAVTRRDPPRALWDSPGANAKEDASAEHTLIMIMTSRGEGGR